MRKFVALIFAAVLVLSLGMPVSAAEGEFVIENGVLTKYNGPGGDVVIPDGVTRIGPKAFAYSSVTGVTIPDSVTSIGNNAFWYCYDLASINLPDSITRIESNAFMFCTSLQSVTIPDSITKIEYGLFINCDSLTSVTIPNSVTSIDGNVFHGCESLTSITLPPNITVIEDNLFEGCESLTSITIPNGVTKIGQRAFSECKQLRSITLPASLTEIGGGAFFACESLPRITIPDGVPEIYNGMFTKCKSLTSIYIPVSATYVDHDAFFGCDSLTDIYYSGSQAQWKDTSHLPYQNDPLQNVAIHYNAKGLPGVGGFTDVSEDAYYADAVLWAVEQKVTSGTSATTFSPDKTCSTAEIIAFLWRACGCPEPGIDNPFPDVPDATYYTAAATWAYEQGLISGSVFDGSRPATRGDTVTYLWKLAGKPAANPAGFTDVDEGAEYAQAVAWAVTEGITTGTGGGKFSPGNTCTRGQIVTFLYRDLVN